MSSFFSLGLDEHLGKENQLYKLSRLLDWSKFSLILKDVHSADGPTGYSPIKMFKCLLLQAWHSLSDPGLEHSLRVRLDFLQFTDFSVGSSLPDETTICRFRNKLVKQGKYEKLFCEVNRQLESHGLKVKSADIAIVDATIISSNARPRRTITSEDNSLIHSSDKDATWLKKGKKCYFGYQGFARSDKAGFIDKTHVTPANLAETKELDKITNGLNKGTRLNADKGFSSKANREMLRKKGLKNGLMYKASPKQALTKRKKQFNKFISQTRWRIEQCFGNIKRRFDFRRASYFTTEKVDAQFRMKAMCHNLLKAVNMIQIA